MKARNILFTVLFCAFLLGPLGVYSTSKAGVDLPSWATAQDSKYLSGGIKTTNIGKNLSVEGFTSEKLQDALETTIGNNIPMKSEAILFNAAAQRAGIAASNALFDWDCYPTYYGSIRLYEAASDSLYRFPYDSTEAKMEAFSSFVELVDSVAADYSDKKFCVYVVDISQFALSNPGDELVDYDVLRVSEYAKIANDLSSADNLSFVSNEVPAPEDYHDFFYTTDHHWNGYGVKRAYEIIAREIGLDDQANRVIGVSDFAGLRMNGSDSRIGLMLLNAPVAEPLFDFSGVEVVEGKAAPVFTSDVDFPQSMPLAAEFDFYHSWFGSGAVELRNEQCSESVLLVGDSYTYSMRWVLGNACQRLVQRIDFSDGQPAVLADAGITLRQRIDAENPDTVVLISTPIGLTTMIEKYPGYFG